MCLVVMAVGQSPEYPLILAGNRDEFHARPTDAAQWWSDKPDIVGGRDLEAGGTWLALHRAGRFATVTNYRDAAAAKPGLRSRGHLVTEFLERDVPPLEYLDGIDARAYAGFNLIAGDGSNVAYLSNRDGGMRELSPGIYGLSNALLDGPWEKVERSKQGITALLQRNAIFEKTLLALLDDRTPGTVDENEAARLGEAAARAITAPFIVTPDYGTRCSTVVTMDNKSQWRLLERRFDPKGEVSGESRFSFSSAA